MPRIFDLSAANTSSLEAIERPVTWCAENGLKTPEVYRDIFEVNRVDVAVKSIRREPGVEVVIFGPYGSAIPAAAPYVRVAYICENYKYDGPACDYIFTVSPQSFPGAHCNRIQWHGLDPQTLVKPSDLDVELLFERKDRFCAFLYSKRVPYREEIFRRLSKYRRVDAPGKSMNNMDSIDKDALPGESRWETKRRFLSRYKFTLALENEVFPGYQTEKLFDAMQSYSLPIYMGDPKIGELFNVDSFVNVGLGGEMPYWLARLQDFSQMRWSECQGPKRHHLSSRMLRRLRLLARDQRHKWLVSKLIDSLVDRVVELDRNPEAYMTMMRQPWLKGNVAPTESYSTHTWERVFADAARRRAVRYD